MRINQANFKIGDKVAKYEYDTVTTRVIKDIIERPLATSDAYLFESERHFTLSIEFMENRYKLYDVLKEENPEYFL